MHPRSLGAVELEQGNLHPAGRRIFGDGGFPPERTANKRRSTAPAGAGICGFCSDGLRLTRSARIKATPAARPQRAVAAEPWRRRGGTASPPRVLCQYIQYYSSMDHFWPTEFTLESFRKANPAMGQGLSNIEAWQLQWNTPRSISKYTDREENVRIKYALSSMQGLCPYMEDAHAAILDLDGARSTSFFGVYDGHGGDFYFKSNETLLAMEQAVTCNPDVRTEAITHDTDFLLIASDGIWDFVSSQGAVDFVQEKFAGGTSDLRTICEELLDHCYSSKGNSTVILVQFRHAARLPHPAPDLPVAHPIDAGGSSNPSSSSAGITQDTGADAKATTGTNAEKKEDVALVAPST
ncbi:hypothetical protein ACQ4PT_060781 [Festuca glaucescens]